MILSACYRRREGGSVPLLLQQYQYKGIQVLFACVFMGGVAEGAGGYMARQLLEWFRRLDPKKLVRNQERAMAKLSDSLAGVIRRIDGELEGGRMGPEEGRVGFAGIFCLGNDYLMLRRGTQGIYLVNTAFNRAHVQRLHGDWAGGEYMGQGSLQPDVGLLFATESFSEHISEAMIKEGLGVGEAAAEEQMGRRLKELVEEGARRGSHGIGAVYLRTV